MPAALSAPAALSVPTALSIAQISTRRYRHPSAVASARGTDDRDRRAGRRATVLSGVGAASLLVGCTPCRAEIVTPKGYDDPETSPTGFNLSLIHI